jgi:hypothetical protein
MQVNTSYHVTVHMIISHHITSEHIVSYRKNDI